MEISVRHPLAPLVQGAISCTEAEAEQMLAESPTLCAVLSHQAKAREQRPTDRPGIDSPSAPGGAEDLPAAARITIADLPEESA